MKTNKDVWTQNNYTNVDNFVILHCFNYKLILIFLVFNLIYNFSHICGIPATQFDAQTAQVEKLVSYLAEKCRNNS